MYPHVTARRTRHGLAHFVPPRSPCSFTSRHYCARGRPPSGKRSRSQDVQYTCEGWASEGRGRLHVCRPLVRRCLVLGSKSNRGCARAARAKACGAVTLKQPTSNIPAAHYWCDGLSLVLRFDLCSPPRSPVFWSVETRSEVGLVYLQSSIHEATPITNLAAV